MTGKKPIAVLSIPFDEKSSYLRGPAQAPVKIWEGFHCSSSNQFTESGIDLSDCEDFQNIGELALEGSIKERFSQIRRAIDGIVGSGRRVLALGGDHSITFPLVHGYSRHYSDLTIVHFDAHGDLYDSLDNDSLSHACPFARIMERGLVNRLVQVGIRTINTHQRAQIERFGVETIEMKNFTPGCLADVKGNVYVSFDMDALDPAFAPGVSHYEPGGLTSRQAIDLIQSLNCNIVGADIVELNPLRDWHDMTAMAAVKMMKEISAKMLEH